MLQTRKITRTILASMLAVMVAVSFYPATAFADTDYEAAYNQAKANTQAAYTEWQNALTNVDTTYSTYQTAKANYETAKANIEPKFQDMLKKHRILDYATRNAMDSLAYQAWNADFGTTNINKYANTDGRINAILNDKIDMITANQTLRNQYANPSTADPFKFNEIVGKGNFFPQGFTTSASGNNDTASIDLYTKYVYYAESYDMLMLTLDYFDELNSLREMRKNIIGTNNVQVLVSPYLMVQAAANSPINSTHATLAKVGTKQCGQNLAFTHGDVDGLRKTNNSDPYQVLFWAEESSNGAHYQQIIEPNVNLAGMACGLTISKRVFEQDLTYANATGYTVSAYRSKINNLVGSELSAYNNAVTAYNNAVNTADDYADIRDDALDDYTDAQSLAGQKETAYNDAQAAEQSAYNDYMNWLNNQNNNSNDGNETPSQPTVPEPTEPTPTEPSVVTPSKVTGLTLIETTQSNQPAIKVTWNATTNASTYKLYQRKANGTWGFRTATSTSTTLTYLSKGTTYEVKVAGVSSDGTEGPVSDVKTLTTTAPAQPADTTPSTNPDPVEVDKVTGVSLKETNITSTGSHIVITWNKTSGASKYIVKYAIDAGGFGPADTYITTTSYTFTKAKPGKTYSFKVIPYGSDGTEGTASDVVKITTTVDVPTAPSNTGEDTNPNATVTPTQQTEPTAPSAPVYVKSFVKSFKVVKGKKSFTAKWKKQSKANQKKFNGYQIRYSTKKSMKGAKYVTVKKSAKSKKIKKLKAKKQYYVQARTYTVTNGKRVYSKWSAIKTVKTK